MVTSGRNHWWICRLGSEQSVHLSGREIVIVGVVGKHQARPSNYIEKNEWNRSGQTIDGGSLEEMDNFIGEILSDSITGKDAAIANSQENVTGVIHIFILNDMTRNWSQVGVDKQGENWYGDLCLMME